MALTLQEKLALSLTSWGSAAAMGEAMGVSTRTVGRWLRAGREGGVKEVPERAKAAINTVFELHRDVVREQARADQIPYNWYRPIYLQRKQLRDGRPGDRVIGEHTEFIERDLRMLVMADQQRSQRYLAASVRSVIDLSRYFRLDAEGNVKQKYAFGKTPAQVASNNLKAFTAREKRERGRIIDKTEPFPLYTRYENISPQRDVEDMRGVIGIEKQMRSKHEPATGPAGTVAADQYLFQLLPAQEIANATQRAAKKRATKKVASKGARKAGANR